MKISFKIIALACVALLPILTSCHDDDEKVLDKIPAVASGTFVDERDGQEYHWVRYANLDWMAENFRYNLNDEVHCLIYLDADEYFNNTASTRNLAKYGRLYDLKGATDACPEGWRLPTDEDWQQLERTLGMSESDVEKMNWRGNIAHRMFSVEDDRCDLNLLLGGYWTANINMGRSAHRMMGFFGYYWSSSLDKSKEGQFYLYRKFAYNRNEVCRQSIEPEAVKLNVRYVRDVK